ncbi:tumor necrosis factor receptor superfamily member 4-like [Lethenteron reissneri]|uniref:tumor necrosis factor receptor superfamily member 4-like n=1 Tax=Lethenteron reissneri TaxID=7753 RepID=UPI002AB7326B|nr:tumor necrosis factor receptor superfamily member 4-like [Lethenteron reissneri]
MSIAGALRATCVAHLLLAVAHGGGGGGGGVVAASAAAACNRTWQYRRDGGACCSKCTPGHYLSARCTADAPSRCDPCPQGTFTADLNTQQRCTPCGQCNTGLGQVSLTRCTSTRDEVCGCLPGSHPSREHDYGSVFRCCRNCPRGLGSLAQCDLVTDVACMPCPPGFHSDGSGGQCRPCTRCPGAELTSCSATNDAVCLWEVKLAPAPNRLTVEAMASSAIGAIFGLLLVATLRVALRAWKQKHRRRPLTRIR